MYSALENLNTLETIARFKYTIPFVSRYWFQQWIRDWRVELVCWLWLGFTQSLSLFSVLTIRLCVSWNLSPCWPLIFVTRRKGRASVSLTTGRTSSILRLWRYTYSSKYASMPAGIASKSRGRCETMASRYLRPIECNIHYCSFYWTLQ